MASSACPTIIGNPAIGLVASGWDTFHNFAVTSFHLAETALQDLSEFTAAPFNFNISYDLAGDWTSYHRPLAPDDVDISFNSDKVNDPGAPPIPTQIVAAFPSMPTANLVEPSINIDDGPGPLTLTAPGPAPTLADIVVPDAPDIVLPDVPTLQALNLPTAPTITLPTFDGVRPVLDFDVPAQTWSFTPEQYTSALLDKVRNQVSLGLDSGTGLPAAIEQALFDRAASRDDDSAIRAMQETREEFSSRGWSEPNGVLSARLRQTRQDSINARANSSRDIYIQNKQLEIENLKFYVTTAVSLESKLIDLHLGIQGLLLDAQKFLLQSAIEIYNARVALFNAQQLAYQTDAQVFRDRLQAVLTELEVYKAEIDAQRLIGEINQQLVAIYTAKLQGVNALVEIFRARVAGVQAQADVNRSIILAFGETVTAYAEGVRAYGIEWDAFKSRVDAEVSKERIYEISTNAFATRVNAWATGNNNIIEQKKLTLSTDDFKLRAWGGKLDRMKAQLSAELGRVDTVVRGYGSRVDRYRADATVETAASDANLRAVQLAIANLQATVDTGLKNAQLHIDQDKNIATIALEKLHGVAQVASQLAAASFSAVHFSAGASSSTSDSQSCETQLRLQG